MIEFKTPYTFDKVVRMFIGLTIIVLIFLLFKKLSPVLTPFFIGWLIAYLLNPIVNFFQFKLKFKSRILSIITTLILFFGSITGIILLLIPQIIRETNKFSVLIRDFTQNINYDTILPVSWQTALINYFEKIELIDLIKDPNIMSLVQKATPHLWSILNGSISFIVGLMIVIVVILYLIFILKDYEKMNASIPEIIPPKYRNLIMGIFDDIKSGMNSYFRGQSLIALIVAILFTIGFLIVGLPMAIVFGIFVGILNLVPYLQAVSIVPAAFLIIIKASEPGQTFVGVLIGVLIVYIAVQLIQDLILVPKIMGKVTGLKPAIILLSLSIWGALMGIIGLIIALPLTTLVISYYRRWVLEKHD
ncbi:MAG: hypothetical protein BGO29_14440 [Bacteroidales bacterium 36-12]|nr:MAG: hypothetical protein BGO29_14440 [Bacteroidales bacterium 36-12]